MYQHFISANNNILHEFGKKLLLVNKQLHRNYQAKVHQLKKIRDENLFSDNVE